MKRFTSQRLFFAWLIVALIGAQAAGFHHAIVHADRIAASGVLDARAMAQAGDHAQWSAVPGHSCAAYDAATLGASAPTIVVVPSGPCGVDVLRRTRAALDPRLRVPLAYRSRAPPFDFLT